MICSDYGCYKQSSEATTIAAWIKRSLPKTQVALIELRELGLVHHFPEKGAHAGLWAVTPAGYLADLESYNSGPGDGDSAEGAEAVNSRVSPKEHEDA
jgi:hypothetical protein